MIYDNEKPHILKDIQNMWLFVIVAVARTDVFIRRNKCKKYTLNVKIRIKSVVHKKQKFIKKEKA